MCIRDRGGVPPWNQWFTGLLFISSIMESSCAQPILPVPSTSKNRKRVLTFTTLCLNTSQSLVRKGDESTAMLGCWGEAVYLSLIHISEPTRLLSISYAVFCLKKKKKGT
eukprot:TRINITY_DN7475_c0_g2_i3.p1 TRINITY_DN7475_c0_g2~~TRINITY_DN7475_c0_g2_i3.p1  ORF type:complete len:110 (+),score=31.06 TRINITY_DN7475_c0_g2_i3:92-421(+)